MSWCCLVLRSYEEQKRNKASTKIILPLDSLALGRLACLWKSVSTSPFIRRAPEWHDGDPRDPESRT